MLPRSQRLSVEQFNTVMEKGRVTHSSLFVLRSLKVKGHSRISTTVPKKVGKTAVIRNKFRRKMYEAIRPLRPIIMSDLHVIVIAKSAITEAEFTAICTEMKNIFVKAGLLK